MKVTRSEVAFNILEAINIIVPEVTTKWHNSTGRMAAGKLYFLFLPIAHYTTRDHFFIYKSY